MPIFTGFMELPLELSIIYDLVLVQTDRSFSATSAHRKIRQRLPPLPQTVAENIFSSRRALVSHQVRAETDPLLYGQNTFEVMLRAAKVVEEPFPQQLARPSRGRKTRLLLLDENPVSETPEHLLYGDRYAAIWAASARPEALARIRRLTVTVEKADLNSQWRHLRHRHLSMSPSSISLERTGVFSAHRWHLHAIELKCPGRHTVVWDVDCRENRMGDRRLKWNAKDV